MFQIDLNVLDHVISDDVLNHLILSYVVYFVHVIQSLKTFIRA